MKTSFFKLFNIISMLAFFGLFVCCGRGPVTGKERSMNDPSLQRATCAGGCFWCMEGPFEAQKGVVEVLSGYTGGHKENPTYEQVSTGTTGHAEAVQVVYDPKQVSY